MQERIGKAPSPCCDLRSSKELLTHVKIGSAAGSWRSLLLVLSRSEKISGTNNNMANKRLSEKDIDQLLGQYRSERRRLGFQLDTVRKAIKDLKTVRSSLPRPAAADGPVIKRGPGRPRKYPLPTPVLGPDGQPIKRGPGRPRKDPNAPPTPQRGRRKKRQVKEGGYRLSDWDTMVIDSIRGREQLLPKEEIVKHAIDWAKKAHPGMSNADVEAKITRVLQKLSGKRGDLGTHRSGLRRGYHYGVKDWFFESSGKLRKQHLPKLVLGD